MAETTTGFPEGEGFTTKDLFPHVPALNEVEATARAEHMRNIFVAKKDEVAELIGKVIQEGNK